MKAVITITGTVEIDSDDMKRYQKIDPSKTATMLFDLSKDIKTEVREVNAKDKK